jgi:hypothetical protein
VKRVLCGLLVLVVVVGGAACGRDSPATSEARIERFVVPAQVHCVHPPATEFSIDYRVVKAMSFVLAVDGRPVPTTASAGVVTAPVHCDGVAHDVVLRAVDKHGLAVTVRKVMTTLAASPTG